MDANLAKSNNYSYPIEIQNKIKLIKLKAEENLHSFINESKISPKVYSQIQ